MPLISGVGRKHFKVKALLILITAILWLGVALHLFPVYWMFTASLKTHVETYKFPPTLFPHNPNFYIYKGVFKGVSGAMPQPLLVYLKNSAIITFGTMVFQVPLCALAAYALSKLIIIPRLNRFLFLFIVGTLFVPGQINLIPNYLIIKNFPFVTRAIPNIPFAQIPFPHHNFLGSYWAVILPTIANAYYVLLFKGFFDGIPNELINAARLDGSSELGIFRRIILPVSKPIFAIIAYFSFSSMWNVFLWPLIVIGSESPKSPLAVQIWRFQQLYFSAGGEKVNAPAKEEAAQHLLQLGGLPFMMAMGIIESIPVFIMFIIFREYLMKGIKLRGFK